MHLYLSQKGKLLIPSILPFLTPLKWTFFDHKRLLLFWWHIAKNVFQAEEATHKHTEKTGLESYNKK